jgi:hypothetical protein
VSRVTDARGRYAILSRYRDSADPELIAAKAELDQANREANQSAREARLRKVIAKQVDAEPPLTEDQRNRLAVILRGDPHAA